MTAGVVRPLLGIDRNRDDRPVDTLQDTDPALEEYLGRGLDPPGSGPSPWP